MAFWRGARGPKKKVVRNYFTVAVSQSDDPHPPELSERRGGVLVGFFWEERREVWSVVRGGRGGEGIPWGVWDVWG